MITAARRLFFRQFTSCSFPFRLPLPRVQDQRKSRMSFYADDGWGFVFMTYSRGKLTDHNSNVCRQRRILMDTMRKLDDWSREAREMLCRTQDESFTLEKKGHFEFLFIAPTKSFLIDLAYFGLARMFARSNFSSTSTSALTLTRFGLSLNNSSPLSKQSDPILLRHQSNPLSANLFS